MRLFLQNLRIRWAELTDDRTLVQQFERLWDDRNIWQVDPAVHAPTLARGRDVVAVGAAEGRYRHEARASA